jgi:tRNA modification GTPase
MDTDDTIVAIASAPSGGLRGIVRVSGRQAIEVVARLPQASDEVGLWAVQSALVVATTIRLPNVAAPLPVDCYVWPGVRSYTREPTVELHTVGSPPLVEALLRLVCAAGARLAQPGEFTLRAFLAGRLDLAQAEAVLGVIDAQDRRSLEVALGQLAGNVSRPLAALRETLLDLLAHLEAGLDFADEDIEFITAAELDEQLAAVLQSLERLSEQLTVRRQSGELVRIVLVGPPNAGKSSLFNRLTTHAALVSPTAGTTRDALTALLAPWSDDAAVVGLAQRCQIVDTAGVDDARVAGIDPAKVPPSIEAAAQGITAAQRRGADLELWCTPSDAFADDDSAGDDAAGAGVRNISEADAAGLAAARWLVVTKADDPGDAWHAASASERRFITSSRTGRGIEELAAAIVEFAANVVSGESVAVAATAARCEESLTLAHDALVRARQTLGQPAGQELVAAELRHALAELGKIVGAVYTDDILDRVFSRFCIGK